jgi:hypothetical protein
MPGNHLTASSQIQCPHGGQAMLFTANAQALAAGSFVLLESDIHPIVGCPFAVGPKYSPCVRIEWSAGSSKTTINGTATLVQSSIGQCINAEGVIQGVAIVVNSQTQASGL